ncbi:hypothetical protein PMALA_070880 [Plasmodium malariae]|uniref:Uncharacterized protein n=1 Tax=Plasmodium malariae TaxID=5858 RepID=A0A1A8X4J8_PLAMA|nr:hypothetical protein PMALA_070880 [Plasmodium malariae]
MKYIRTPQKRPNNFLALITCVIDSLIFHIGGLENQFYSFNPLKMDLNQSNFETSNGFHNANDIGKLF